jgi:hypothetical protein
MIFYFVFNGLRREVMFIGGIDDHHYLNFFSHNLYMRMCLFGPFLNKSRVFIVYLLHHYYQVLHRPLPGCIHLRCRCTLHLNLNANCT